MQIRGEVAGLWVGRLAASEPRGIECAIAHLPRGVPAFYHAQREEKVDTMDTSDTARGMLRHTVATLAYRGGKALRDAPPEFGDLRIAPSSRRPIEILAHIGDLLDWSLSITRGTPVWHDSRPGGWDAETERFFAGLAALDALLAAPEPLACSPERLFQGPIADALSHVGQLAMLRRVCGAPVRGENYFMAEIAAGRVGDDQAAPRREFE
jgi:hypothetical protein